MTVIQLEDRIKELKESGHIVDGTEITANAELEFRLNLSEENKGIDITSKAYAEEINFELDSADFEDGKLKLTLI